MDDGCVVLENLSYSQPIFSHDSTENLKHLGDPGMEGAQQGIHHVGCGCLKTHSVVS